MSPKNTCKNLNKILVNYSLTVQKDNISQQNTIHYRQARLVYHQKINPIHHITSAYTRKIIPFNEKKPLKMFTIINDINSQKNRDRRCYGLPDF